MCEVTTECKRPAKFWVQIISTSRAVRDVPSNILTCGVHLSMAVMSIEGKRNNKPYQRVTVKVRVDSTNEYK